MLFIGELTFSKTQIYSPYGVFFIIVLAFLGYMALKVSVENPIDRQIDYIKQNIQCTNEIQQDLNDKKSVGGDNEKPVYELLIKELGIRVKTLESTLNNALEQKKRMKV